jgi:hypothetical protein
MIKVTYEVVEHDGGWAYRVNGVYSETFPTHALAHKAAERAAREQVSLEKRRASHTRIKRAIGMMKSPPATIGRRQALRTSKPASSSIRFACEVFAPSRD